MKGEMVRKCNVSGVTWAGHMRNACKAENCNCQTSEIYGTFTEQDDSDLQNSWMNIGSYSAAFHTGNGHQLLNLYFYTTETTQMSDVLKTHSLLFSLNLVRVLVQPRTKFFLKFSVKLMFSRYFHQTASINGAIALSPTIWLWIKKG